MCSVTYTNVWCACGKLYSFTRTEDPCPAKGTSRCSVNTSSRTIATTDKCDKCKEEDENKKKKAP